GPRRAVEVAVVGRQARLRVGRAHEVVAADPRRLAPERAVGFRPHPRPDLVERGQVVGGVGMRRVPQVRGEADHLRVLVEQVDRGGLLCGRGWTGDRLAMQDVGEDADRKSTRLNSSHVKISYAVFCLKKKKTCNM